VNIALVNELKIVYGAMGIDVWEVINAAKTKPFGYMPFYPGPGLGGHCLPIDPFYLAWKAREFGQTARFVELAGEVNTAMPLHVFRVAADALNARRKPVNGSRVLFVGLAYKPNVDDLRESPTFALFDLFKAHGAEVAYHDPFIPVIGPTREHAEWKGLVSVAWTEASVKAFDVVVVVTAHAAVSHADLIGWSDCIVDTRNALAPFPGRPGQVWKA
jgi:UDP-N-acetyl-D-glucosamine dehydrogenase